MNQAVLFIQGFQVNVEKVGSKIQVERLNKQAPLDVIHNVEKQAANEAHALFNMPDEQVTDGL